jgi:predicted ribosomally synthesized peptide with SipW-like signal peptide
MNKILKSVAVIAFVAAIAVGATSAYFSDEEKAVGNTFTAGTIDIAIDGENPWTKHYDIPDLKPGETGYINFNIQNVGANPVNVTKNLSGFDGNTGSTGYVCTTLNNLPVSSEPECVAATTVGSDKNDLESQIIYDLSVEVYNAQEQKTWWQTIYTDAEGKSLANVYIGEDQSPVYVTLGMIPVGGHMKVTQSYHFDKDAGNIYQGDVLSFDITIKGEQLPQGDNGMASVILEDKTAGPEYRIMTETAPKATLSYKTSGPLFVYALSGVVSQPNTNYVLLSAKDPWPQTGSVAIANLTSDGSNNISVSGSMDTGSLVNAKMWVVLASDWNGTIMTAWNQPAYLLETGLVNYTK